MTDIKRRKFVTLLGASATVIPVSALVASLPSHAAEPVDPDSAEAKQLQYVSESENAEQNCNNCMLYTADGDASGGCPLFQNAVVMKGGWCSAWTAKG